MSNTIEPFEKCVERQKCRLVYLNSVKGQDLKSRFSGWCFSFSDVLLKTWGLRFFMEIFSAEFEVRNLNIFCKELEKIFFSGPTLDQNSSCNGNKCWQFIWPTLDQNGILFIFTWDSELQYFWFWYWSFQIMTPGL